MSTDTIATFETSLSNKDVGSTRTSESEFADTITRLVTEPAIETSLGIDSIPFAVTQVKTDPTPQDLTEAKTGVTPIGHAIAPCGTLVVGSNAVGNEPVGRYPPTHIGGVSKSGILDTVNDVFPSLCKQLENGGSATFATGPGFLGDRSALIEGAVESKTVHAAVVEGS